MWTSIALGFIKQDTEALAAQQPEAQPEEGLVAHYLDMLQANVIEWGANLLIALLIFLIGKRIVAAAAQGLRTLMARAKLDAILVNFLGSIAHGLMMLFVVVAAVRQLGIDTSSMVALIGAAGLALGFALQDSLGNFASGVLLILFRPFTTGDYVEAGGISGTVERITIFTTVLRTGDNREIIVPNSAIFGDTITNYSTRDTRRIDMVFGIGYGDDLQLAKDTLMGIMIADERVLKDPEPSVAVAELADSSVNLKVRPWVKTDDYWSTLSDITEKVKLTFDEKGISIPYPTQDVNVLQP
jgi:small conductance mechanosensitive channel